MGEHVIKPLTSPAMQDAATETHSSLTPFIVLNHKLHDWEEQKTEHLGDSKGTQILLIV